MLGKPWVMLRTLNAINESKQQKIWKTWMQMDTWIRLYITIGCRQMGTKVQKSLVDGLLAGLVPKVPN